MSLLIELGSVVNECYQIKEIIKQSQFETIYLAEDTSRYNENCILTKLTCLAPRNGLAFESLLRAELETLTNLNHSQIQETKSFFWQDEDLFIVQSYIAGQTYQDWLFANSCLTEQQATQLLNQTLVALSYLHSRQLTHANISPSNILLRSIDSSSILTNFGMMGIKSQMGIPLAENRLVDQIKQLPVGFISPGVGEDLYALAVTVIVLLTGKNIQVLFNYQTQIWDWERWKLVSDRLTDTLNQMLSTQATTRFPSADAALQALNAVATPTTTYIPTPPQFSTSVAAIPQTEYLERSNTGSKVSNLSDWQKAVITGGVIGTLIVGGLWVTKEKQSDVATVPSSQQAIARNNSSGSQIESSSSPPLATYPSQSENSAPPQVITKEQAVALIRQWQRSKAQIFAQPFDRQLGYELTTGEVYQKTFGPDGSVDWLENNNAYYRYGVQNIDSVDSFYSSSDRATIEVVITEERTLYKNGKIDRQQTALDTRLVRYSLQLDNGQLKIADYNTVRKIRG